MEPKSATYVEENGMNQRNIGSVAFCTHTMGEIYE